MAQQIGNQPFGTSAGMPNLIGGLNQFFQTCTAPEILESFYCATFVDQVTTKARLQSLLTNHGLEYIYTRMSEPVVFSGTFLENQEFASPTVPEGTQCKIRLGYRAYTNEKIPSETLKYMVPGARSAFMADRHMRYGIQLAQKHQADFLCWLASQVHPCNEGAHAGVVSGSINLGTINAPVLINPRNVHSIFGLLDQTLDEHNLPQTDRAAIFSTPVKFMLSQAVGNAIANTGRGVSAYMNGMCGMNLELPCGRDAYVTNCLPPIKNASGQLVYPIYYLWKRAIDGASGMDAEKSGVFSTDGVRDIYKVERMFMTYGFANIYCQGIARAWVAIDPNWMDKLPGGSCA
jgi:hypothetical protein